MTRREFFALLSRSGLLVAGAGSLGPLPAWAQMADVDAPAAGPSFALNPVGPYLVKHPLPWSVPSAQPNPQKFDLLYWTAHVNKSFGQLSIQAGAPNDGGFTVRRSIDNDDLTAEFQCASDAWRTPRSWTITGKPKGNNSKLDLTSTLTGSFDGKKASLGGRTPDAEIAQPLTTFAALAGSVSVLEHAAQAGMPFFALNERGLLIGPLQAKAQPAINGPDEKPLLKVVVLWGPRVVPTNIVYDSAGTVAQTGFIVSSIRSSIT